MALSVQLDKINDASAAQSAAAKYGDIVTYQLRITNNGNQPAVPTVELDIPAGLTATEATAAKLSDGKLIPSQPIAPGEHIDVELAFKVGSVAASASLVLHGKAATVATPEGEVKTDINLNDNDDEASTPIKNPPVVLTVVNALDKNDKLAGAELKVADKDGKTVFTGTTGEKVLSRSTACIRGSTPLPKPRWQPAISCQIKPGALPKGVTVQQTAQLRYQTSLRWFW